MDYEQEIKEKNMSFEVNIKVKGKTIPSYFHEGDTWVEGRVGSEYTLEFKNNSNTNVLIVPSVDGLSIFDGKPATEQSKGYIVNRWSTIEIPGWTLDLENVAKFVFSSVDNSYSTYQSGNSDNNGVIGFKVFYEKEKPIDIIYDVYLKNPIWDVIPYNMERPTLWGSASENSIMRSANAMNISASANSTMIQVDHSVGTGFGDKEQFKTREVEFERGNLAKTIVIYYDSLKNLKARGINVEPQRKKPSPFKEIGCIPPKGWSK